ncbi:shikimate kinase [Thalassorhabdus alkalitolerans]|uniref:Shikimate kinase n=1 Tax=Thalassorhabdus alkalitolerans TaxID=2282697 RepID=A0ABW0YNK5_9BACI
MGPKVYPLRERNIVLIGFMGVGKTSVGSLLAKNLFRDFIDIDQEIEKKYSMKVPDIFKELGEKKFREMEREMTISWCRDTRLKVISLGGGAYAQPDIRKVCLESNIVISLDLTWDSWKDRLDLIIDSRPVLQNKSLEEIEALYKEREQMYKLNSFEVETDEKDVEEVVDYIVSSLKLGWELYQPQPE